MEKKKSTSSGSQSQQQTSNKMLKILLGIMGAVALAVLVCLILTVSSLFDNKKVKQDDVTKESEYSTENRVEIDTETESKAEEVTTTGAAQELVSESNAYMEYWDNSEMDINVFNSLAGFMRDRYFFSLNYSPDCEGTYYMYYGNELLRKFGYELSYESYAKSLADCRRWLSDYDWSEFGYYVMKPIKYEEKGEYYLFTFTLAGSKSHKEPMQFTYTIWYDDVSDGYKVLDFDIADIYKQEGRFTKLEGNDTVPGTNGLFFESESK